MTTSCHQSDLRIILSNLNPSFLLLHFDHFDRNFHRVTELSDKDLFGVRALVFVTYRFTEWFSWWFEWIETWKGCGVREHHIPIRTRPLQFFFQVWSLRISRSIPFAWASHFLRTTPMSCERFQDLFEFVTFSHVVTILHTQWKRAKADTRRWEWSRHVYPLRGVCCEKRWSSDSVSIPRHPLLDSYRWCWELQMYLFSSVGVWVYWVIFMVIWTSRTQDITINRIHVTNSQNEPIVKSCKILRRKC